MTEKASERGAMSEQDNVCDGVRRKQSIVRGRERTSKRDKRSERERKRERTSERDNE